MRSTMSIRYCIILDYISTMTFTIRRAIPRYASVSLQHFQRRRRSVIITFWPLIWAPVRPSFRSPQSYKWYRYTLIEGWVYYLNRVLPSDELLNRLLSGVNSAIGDWDLFRWRYSSTLLADVLSVFCYISYKELFNFQSLFNRKFGAVSF